MAALRQVDQEWEKSFTRGLDLLCVAGTDGYFRRVNPAFEGTLGYTAEELCSMPFVDFVHPDDREKTLEELRALRMGRDMIRFRNRYQCKDGSWRWLEWTCPAPSASSDVIYATARDISDVKQLEEMHERQRQFTDEANRAKSEFLSRMSHELRTPLNAVLGFAQLMEMDEPAPGHQQSLSRIRKAGEYLLTLIDEVLDITRIEQGRMTFSLEPVAVCRLMSEVLDLMRPLAMKEEIDLEYSWRADASHDLYVLADAHRLKQVVLNLLSNAVKYNRQGGAVTLDCQVMASASVRLLVQDTGLGIAPDKFNRLFAPFDRLDAEQTAVPGTGLGLALSKRLVEAMGGTMGVESVVHQGSTFWVEFPQVDTVDRLGEKKSPTRHTVSEHQNDPLSIGSVLYIEDNLSNVELIEQIMAVRPGIRLITAMQGQLGLELAAQHRPSLILLDLHLPDVSGQEVLRRLQSNPQTRTIPVVVISADASPGVITRLREAGAKDFLTKPINVERLLALLDAVIGG